MEGDVDSAFRRFEQQAWEQKASAYHRVFGPVIAPVADALVDAADITSGSLVLDVGCGPGYVAAAAARRGALVLGVDIAWSMVELARRLNPTLTFCQADVEHLPFNESRFSAITAGFLLPHLPRAGERIRGLSGLLRPGGRIAVSTWDAPRRCVYTGLLMEALDSVIDVQSWDPSWGPPPRPLPGNGLGWLLRTAGLAGVVEVTVASRHRVPSVDRWWSDLLASTVRLSAVVADQEPDVQQRIKAAFEALAEPYRRAEGIIVPVSVLVASGRRVDSTGARVDRG
jgi:SAM-dependent methyltransferase